MLEVIYISPSCKQAAEFIDRLMWDLRKHGIYDFEIDPGKMQIRTDKFIVSAVSTFSGIGILESNRFATDYYIDMVSGFEFPNKYTRENSIMWIKILKGGFRKGVKEISEEELIGILTEAYK